MLRIVFLALIVLSLGTVVFGAAPVQSGLVLHLDANSLTGYTNGQTVATWPDLAVADGNDNNATSAGTPTYVANALNGKPVIKIDGTSDRYGNGLTAQYDFYAIEPNILNVKTIAFVFKPTSNTYYTWSTIMSGPTSDNYGWHSDTHWGSAYWDYSYTAGSIASSIFRINGGTPVDGGWTSVDYDNFSVIIMKLAAGTPFDLGFLAHTARYNGYNEYGMEIAELLVYDRVITDVEENKIGYYLTNKYGIATSYTGDPVVGDPSPADKDGGFSTAGMTLTWDVANGVSPTSTVWFGPQGSMTQRATGLTTKSWATGALSPDTVYEWRIDLVDGAETFTGPVWSFRTILNATKVLDWGLGSSSTGTASPAHQNFIAAGHIAATASNADWGSASATLSDNGLYSMGHIVYPYAYSWITAVNGGDGITANPHPVNGTTKDAEIWGAWIEYTFDSVYTIGNMYVWNQNQVSDTDNLTCRGLRNVTVQYSVDGTTWNTLGSYTISQATGLNGLLPYTIDFGGASAKYVVITAAWTDGQWGPDPGTSNSFYALAKVRFGTYGTTATEATTPDSAGYLSSGEGIVKGSPQIVQGISATNNCMSFTGETDAVASKVLGSNFPAAGAAQWSMNFYVYLDEQPSEYDVIAGFGSPTDYPNGARRYIISYGSADNPSGSKTSQIYFWGQYEDLGTDLPFDIARWQMITATYDGANLKLYKNGSQVASKKAYAFEDAAPVINLAARSPINANAGKFKGKIDDFTVYKGVLSQSDINTLAQALPLAGNFNADTVVNFKDLAAFGDKWMTDNAVHQWPTAVLLNDMEGANALDAWSVSPWNNGTATIQLIQGNVSDSNDPNQPFEGSQAVRMTYDNTVTNSWSVIDVNLGAPVDMTKYDLLRIHLKRHVGNSRELFMYFEGFSPNGDSLFRIEDWANSSNLPAGVWETTPGGHEGDMVIWYDQIPWAHQVKTLSIGVRGPYDAAGGTGTIDIDSIFLEKFDNCLGTILEGDFNADCSIDIEDLVTVADNWLKIE